MGEKIPGGIVGRSASVAVLLVWVITQTAPGPTAGRRKCNKSAEPSKVPISTYVPIKLDMAHLDAT